MNRLAPSEKAVLVGLLTAAAMTVVGLGWSSPWSFWPRVLWPHPLPEPPLLGPGLLLLLVWTWGWLRLPRATSGARELVHVAAYCAAPWLLVACALDASWRRPGLSGLLSREAEQATASAVLVLVLAVAVRFTRSPPAAGAPPEPTEAPGEPPEDTWRPGLRPETRRVLRRVGALAAVALAVGLLLRPALFLLDPQLAVDVAALDPDTSWTGGGDPWGRRFEVVPVAGPGGERLVVWSWEGGWRSLVSRGPGGAYDDGAGDDLTARTSPLADGLHTASAVALPLGLGLAWVLPWLGPRRRRGRATEALLVGTLAAPLVAAALFAASRVTLAFPAPLLLRDQPWLATVVTCVGLGLGTALLVRRTRPWDAWSLAQEHARGAA